MTFLELMVAMVILGLLMAVTVPRMVGGSQMAQLRGAAREIVALMRFARATAVFGEVEVELRFAPEEGLFGLHFDPVALEVGRRVRRSARGGAGRVDRRLEEAARERAEQWLSPRALPTDRLGRPAVHFAAVETELELPRLSDPRATVPGVVFYPDGTASGGRIILENLDGARMSIEVLTATALATVTLGDVRDEEQAL